MSSPRPSSPQPLPSLPPSPTEEDVSTDVEPSRRKGKEREHSADTAYPPINDEEAETRRVEENLKRWEVAERRRRKAARETAQGTQSPSLVSEVSRRASLMWTARRPPSRPVGNHTALQSQESVDNLPLEAIPASASPSPRPSTANPFVSSDEPAVMNPSEDPPTLDSTTATSPVPTRPTLQATLTSFSKPPPPQPINIPPPRTPPPRIDMEAESNSPLNASQTDSLEADGKEVRWWHEWLCGCGEGSDRGGENQVRVDAED